MKVSYSGAFGWLKHSVIGVKCNMSHNSTSMLNNKFRENFPLEKKFWTLWIKPENDKNES